jgi:uncharacterized membrane protein YbaN (DUF454 family)
MLALRIALAAIFSAIGIAGLILPILPGWLFFLFAFAVLAPQHRYTKKWVAWIDQRAPRTARVLRRMGVG